MTVSKMIEKFKLELAEKDGVKGFRMQISKKPSATEIEELKANKPAIMIELEKRESDRKAKNIVDEEVREARRTILKAEYIASANLKRYLVCYHDYDCNRIDWSIETLELTTEGIAYQSKFLTSNRIELPQVTAKIKELNTKTFTQYGMSGIAYEITDAQESELVAEQEIAIVEAEKLAEIKKIENDKQIEIRRIEKENIRNDIFAKAKETGEKQLLVSWSEPCNDRNEECDVDMCYNYAMPDGSVEVVRHHTW